MSFRPEEVLFSPTTICNLTCPHCAVPRSRIRLSVRAAARFLRECSSLGVKRVGFTGGEPFLATDFLCALSSSAVREGMLFDRIMTNAVWWAGPGILRKKLLALRSSGFDGDICVSVDAFHDQDLRKISLFIRSAVAVWGRPDIVSIAYVTGARDKDSARIHRSLARILGGRVHKKPGGKPYIKSRDIFIRTSGIDIAPTGKAERIRPPWDGRWFEEDRCKGPGNVFLVMPDGSVKPCCGYSSDNDALTIGNIRRDSAAAIVKKFEKNRFASTVFKSGLSAIRRRLEHSGYRLPGRTSSHCYFCHYLLTAVPKGVLEKCLDKRS